MLVNSEVHSYVGVDKKTVLVIKLEVDLEKALEVLDTEGGDKLREEYGKLVMGAIAQDYQEKHHDSSL